MSVTREFDMSFPWMESSGCALRCALTSGILPAANLSKVLVFLMSEGNSKGKKIHIAQTPVAEGCLDCWILLKAVNNLPLGHSSYLGSDRNDALTSTVRLHQYLHPLPGVQVMGHLNDQHSQWYKVVRPTDTKKETTLYAVFVNKSNTSVKWERCLLHFY